MSSFHRISLECPHCGATMRMSENKKSFICDFCGHSELIQEEDHQKIAYEQELGRAKARERAASQTIAYKANAALSVFKIVALGAVLTIILIFVLGMLAEVLTPAPTANPYEWAEISVSGISGDGSISIKNTNTGELAGVKFTPSKSYNLSNGDIITITAEKGYDYSDYVWEPETMEYTVSDLPSYLSSLSELSDDQRNMIQESSLALLNENWEYNKQMIKEGLTWEIQPMEQILFGKGRYHCLLYDCYETHVHNDYVGDLTIYQAVRYAEPVINPKSPSQVLYSDKRLDNRVATSFWFGIQNLNVKEYGWTSKAKYEDYWVSLQNVPLPLLDRLSQ